MPQFHIAAQESIENNPELWQAFRRLEAQPMNGFFNDGKETVVFVKPSNIGAFPAAIIAALSKTGIDTVDVAQYAAVNVVEAV